MVHGAVSWKRDNTTVVSMYIQSNVCSSFDGGANLSLNYRYNCTDNKTYNVIIPGDRILQEDGSQWQCTNLYADGKSGILTLSVASKCLTE